MQKSDFKSNVFDEFGPPIVQVKKDYLEVFLPAYFRDEGWANGMGLVQNEINRWAIQDSSTPQKVVFDFSSCRWVDPLPLMSVLLEVANSKYLGMTVAIRLPNSDAGPNPSEIGPYQKSPNRLLRFLDQEGFFDCIKMLDVPIFYGSSNLHMDRRNYQNLHVTPSYEDARCIPMHLFTVPTEKEESEFARNSVESLLTGVDIGLDSKVAPHARERLIYKLRVALQEVLHNAQEHAYETDTVHRTLAIYVRYRTGGLGLDSMGKQIFLKHVSEERTRCPMLDADWLTAKPGCLEVFVLDRGVGIVHNFEKAGIKLEHKYKFNEVMQKTFVDGRSTKPERLTRYGGLHLLHNLLSETGDFLRALEDEIWFASGVPLFRSTARTYQLVVDQTHLHGLAMHLRLAWKEGTDYGGSWAKFKQGEQSEVWPELCLSKNDCKTSFDWFSEQKVIDERFGVSKAKEYGEYGGWILWLVQPHRMKRDIINFIEYKIAPHVSKETILIIADIPSYEAATYAAALDKFKALGSTDWPAKFSRIILSTNRWGFAVVDYQKHGNQHGFSSLYEDFDDIQIKPPPITPRPENFRLAIVRWLKWHDSRRLWDEVHERKQMFISEKILWGNNKDGEMRVIEGYLDFPQTTHNDLCAVIYVTALARIFGIMEAKEVELYPLDRLTMTVLREVHATEVYEPAITPAKDRLAIGSVLVSGATLKASAVKSVNLHFFIHYSSPLLGSYPSLLFWLPKVQVKNTESKLARIGNTATIAPEGWKSFEVPRFDDKGKCVGDRDPEKTYHDWQNPSPVIVKAGHWSYEGQHDFLTVNIATAVDAAFLEKNDLSRFLVSRILPFIGLSKTHVNESWHRLLEGQYGNKSSQEFNPANYGLLVYRSHPNSELVIRKLLELLTPEGKTVALSRIFPVLPIRRRWSGSALLIPPLVREDIRMALKAEDKDLPILLFDDAAITGRTLHDMRVALNAIGAMEINTLVIVNRLRQPAEGHVNEHIDYYWRLDLPLMGREGNCPLCHALNLVESFSGSLASTKAKDKIRAWKHRWGNISPLDNWSSGLRPVPLASTKSIKYCYRQNRMTTEEEKYMAKIDLIRSTGLSIHVAELHAMTGRDDYCLKKIREYSEPEIRIELAASQLLLFGDEFDQDIRVELVQTLIRELGKLKTDSLHAPLAVLATIGGLDLLDIEAKHEVAKVVIEDGWSYQENYAAKILLAYLVSMPKISDNQMPIDSDTDAYKTGISLLSTASWSLAQRLNAWYLNTLSLRGNAHSEPIPLFIIELEKPTTIKVERIHDVMDSLDHLADIVDSVERRLALKKASQKLDDSKQEMKKCADAVRNLLTQKIIGNESAEWREATTSALEKYINAMKSVADAYFYRIPSTQNYHRERTFETREIEQVKKTINWSMASEGKKMCNGTPVSMNDRIIYVSLTGTIDFDSNAGEVWIVWHRGIFGIVLDLLRNAVYADVQIPDPWDSGRKESADIWVRVDYERESVALTLASASISDTKTVFQELEKNKHRWSELTNIGGRVEPVDVPLKNTVGVRVRIPYAGFLNCEKEKI